MQMTYRAPMAFPSASTVSTGAGVLAFGVATFVVLVAMACKLLDFRDSNSLQIKPMCP